MKEKENAYTVIPFEGLFKNSLFGFVKYINPSHYGIYGYITGDVKMTLSRHKFSLNAMLKRGGWFQTICFEQEETYSHIYERCEVTNKVKALPLQLRRVICTITFIAQHYGWRCMCTLM
jgi:hypothetical protein